MRIDDVYGNSEWIKAKDLRGKDWVLEIARISDHTFPARDDQPAKQQLVLHFRGATKKLGLNTTNAHAIGEMYGPESDDWVGKTITLYPTKDRLGAKIVDCIRIRNHAMTSESRVKLSVGNGPRREPRREGYEVMTDAREADEADNIPF